MNKLILEQFINKYHLGGAIDVALWESDGISLSTRVGTDSRDAIGVISTTGIIIEQGKFPVIDTGQLLHMLGVLQNDIELTVQKKSDKNVSFTFTDGRTTVTKVLAYEDAIPKPPTLNNNSLPTSFDVEFELTADFISTFLTAKGALSESKDIVFKSDGTQLQAIVGYEQNINTNRIVIDVASTVHAPLSHISFNIEVFRSVLMANKNATYGSAKISGDGLCHINFVAPTFTVDYYLLQIKST